MCSYCQDIQSLFWRQDNLREDLDRLELYIEQDENMTISHTNAYTGEQENINIGINYCPMCGRKLKQEDRQNDRKR